MMLGKVAVCGLVLLCLVWTEDAEAGTSFLSPAEMQKHAQGKKTPKKLLTRREEGDAREGRVDELPDDQREIGVKIPLYVNLKMTQDQFQQQKAAIQDIVSVFLSLGSSQDIPEKTE